MALNVKSNLPVAIPHNGTLYREIMLSPETECVNLNPKKKNSVPNSGIYGTVKIGYGVS